MNLNIDLNGLVKAQVSAGIARGVLGGALAQLQGLGLTPMVRLDRDGKEWAVLDLESIRFEGDGLSLPALPAPAEGTGGQATSGTREPEPPKGPRVPGGKKKAVTRGRPKQAAAAKAISPRGLAVINGKRAAKGLPALTEAGYAVRKRDGLGLLED